MAKMIKCPTCGTQIEVPAQPSGQVIKCPGCGKGLKLVAKKKEPTPGGAGIQLSASGSPISSGGAGGSMAGGSMSGASVSAMTFHDAPAPQDDLPNLDSVCQVCGRPAEFDELTEDNGKLVCRDCIKGARSSIARPKGGAELVDFKAPEYRPTRRAKMINVTPAFLLACFLGIIWCICQVYLSTHPEPKGTAMASMTKQTKPGAHDLSKAPSTPEPAPTTAPSTSIENQTAAAATTQPIAPAPTAIAGSQPSTPAAVPTSQAVAAGPTPSPQDNTIFTDSGKPATGTGTAVIPPPQPDPANTDPIDRGVAALQRGDYRVAKTAFEEARTKYIVGGRLDVTLTPQQTQVLNGLAAANVGLGKPDDAKYQFNILVSHKDHSRALILNRAIAMLMESSIGPAEFNVAVPELKSYLDAAPADDERAVDVFGSVLARLSQMKNVKRSDMETFWNAYDGYVDRLAGGAAGGAHAGQLKWGVDWMPADQVKTFRASRSVTTGLSPQQAGKNLEMATARKKAADAALDTAKQLQAAGKPADLVGAQKRVEDATKAEADAQHDFASVATAATPPKWLDPKKDLAPVLP